MKLCPNCGRANSLAAHPSCDGGAGRISLHPNPYKASSTVIHGGHTPPHGTSPYLELPARWPTLLGAALSLWYRGIPGAFFVLLAPFAAWLLAVSLPFLLDAHAAHQLELATALFVPLWIAAEAAATGRLSHNREPEEGGLAYSLRSWSTAFRHIPKLLSFHLLLLLLVAVYTAPAALLAWIWPQTGFAGVALALLGAAWPWARYSLALPLVMLEGYPVSIAMRISRKVSARYMGRLWRLFAVLLLALVGGVFLAGRSALVFCQIWGIDTPVRGFVLLGIVLLVTPSLYGPLVAARIVLKEALPRVRFVTPPVVLAVFAQREAAELVSHRLAELGIPAEVVGGTDIGALRLLVTDAQVIVAEQDLEAARHAVKLEG